MHRRSTSEPRRTFGWTDDGSCFVVDRSVRACLATTTREPRESRAMRQLRAARRARVRRHGHGVPRAQGASARRAARRGQATASAPRDRQGLPVDARRRGAPRVVDPARQRREGARARLRQRRAVHRHGLRRGRVARRRAQGAVRRRARHRRALRRAYRARRARRSPGRARPPRRQGQAARDRPSRRLARTTCSSAATAARASPTSASRRPPIACRLHAPTRSRASSPISRPSASTSGACAPCRATCSRWPSCCGSASPVAVSSAATRRSRRLQEVVSAPIPSLRRIGAPIPQALDDTILRGLSRDLETRYKTAAEFADALQRAVRRAAQHRDAGGGRVPRRGALRRAAPRSSRQHPRRARRRRATSRTCSRSPGLNRRPEPTPEMREREKIAIENIAPPAPSARYTFGNASESMLQRRLASPRVRMAALGAVGLLGAAHPRRRARAQGQDRSPRSTRAAARRADDAPRDRAAAVRGHARDVRRAEPRALAAGRRRGLRDPSRERRCAIASRRSPPTARRPRRTCASRRASRGPRAPASRSRRSRPTPRRPRKARRATSGNFIELPPTPERREARGQGAAWSRAPEALARARGQRLGASPRRSPSAPSRTASRSCDEHRRRSRRSSGARRSPACSRSLASCSDATTADPCTRHPRRRLSAVERRRVRGPDLRGGVRVPRQRRVGARSHVPSARGRRAAEASSDGSDAANDAPGESSRPFDASIDAPPGANGGPGCDALQAPDCSLGFALACPIGLLRMRGPLRVPGRRLELLRDLQGVTRGR